MSDVTDLNDYTLPIGEAVQLDGSRTFFDLAGGLFSARAHARSGNSKQRGRATM